MELLQTFTGIVNRGFKGNIVYNFNLEHRYSKLYICLSFDQEKISDYDDDFRKKIEEAYEKHHGNGMEAGDFDSVIASMKTEIQLALLINGDFVGNVHKPGSRIEKMIISGENASPGCLPCDQIHGLVKIIINSFNILEDHTSYRLVIKGDLQHV